MSAISITGFTGQNTLKTTKKFNFRQNIWIFHVNKLIFIKKLHFCQKRSKLYKKSWILKRKEKFLQKFYIFSQEKGKDCEREKEKDCGACDKKIGISIINTQKNNILN